MSDSAANARDLLSTTDAQVWARAFMERFGGLTVGEGTVDEGTMIGWFANAIETGREAGRKLIAIHVEEDDDELDLRY